MKPALVLPALLAVSILQGCALSTLPMKRPVDAATADLMPRSAAEAMVSKHLGTLALVQIDTRGVGITSCRTQLGVHKIDEINRVAYLPNARPEFTGTTGPTLALFFNWSPWHTCGTARYVQVASQANADALALALRSLGAPFNEVNYYLPNN